MSYLKPCFLYLGTFLEDEYLDAKELHLLWIAEGMVLSEHRRNGETLLNVAERYLVELGQRSMVQMQVNGFSTSCRLHLHDVMRDFCLKKGREEEFSEVIDLRGVEKPLLDSVSHTNNDVYRLVVHINTNVETPVNANAIVEDFKQLCCLLFRNSDGAWCSRKKIIWAEGLNVNYKTFKSLRVLKFDKYDFEGQDLATGLEKLIHLRLLCFRGCNFDLSGLPSSITELPFLQTLDLRVSYLSKMPNVFLYAFNVIEMPNVLGKMKSLRHLYLPTSAGIEVKEKVRLYGLSELERLEGFLSDRDEIADLYELPNLRVLDVAVTNNEGLCAIMNYMNISGKNLPEISLTLSGVLSIESEQGSILLRSLLAFENLHHLSKFPRYE
ncbi:probable disease resistance protein RXW24L [Coffea arabica]|uniref:Probable disease resistance protein RXW24L n=1 Tax=Coffea arabica TaxID=13443 RepID=A0A6P6VG81_COFAR|nr:putative disease resistance protein At1g58400 [Coffea arabica]